MAWTGEFEREASMPTVNWTVLYQFLLPLSNRSFSLTAPLDGHSIQFEKPGHKARLSSSYAASMIVTELADKLGLA